MSEAPRPGRTILRWIGIVVAALVGIPIVVVAVIVAFGITISLDTFRPGLQSAAGNALGRAVTIEGPLTLHPSLPPAVAARSIRVAGLPPSDTGDVLRIDRARVSVRLLPLARREIHIDEVAVEGIELRLGPGIGEPADSELEPEPSAASGDSPEGASFEFVRLHTLSIDAVVIEYRDEGSGEAFEVIVERLEGSVGRDDPTVLAVRGTAEQQPFTLSFAGGSLADLGDAGRPWPVSVEARLADTVASIAGAIADPLGHPAADIDIALKADQLETIEALLKTAMPAIGACDLKAHLEVSSSGGRLSAIEGSLGETTFGGDIALDLDADPPRLSGRIDIAALDLEPFLGDESGASAPELGAADDPDEGVALDDVALSIEGLDDIDADVTVSVDRILGLPMDIRDADVAASIEDGRLSVPISAIVSDVPIEGRLAIETGDEGVGFDVALSSEGSDVENLRNIMQRAKGVKGSFERFTLQGTARGSTLRAALEDLDARVLLGRADLSYGHEGGGEPVSLLLEKFELSLPRGEALRVATRGTMFDRDFTLEVAGATVAEALAGGAWPVELSASGVATRLSVVGNLADAGDPSGTALRVELAGDRIGDLAAWIGTSPDSVLPFAVSGDLRFDDDRAYLESARAHLGRTALEGDFSAGRQDEGLLFAAKARFSRIDTEELGTLLASTPDAGDQEERPGFNLNMPILPYGVAIADADFNIRVDRILMDPVDVTAVSFKGRIREGFLQKSPFALTLGRVPFSGEASLDLREKAPVATLDIVSKDVDVGGLLNQLEITTSSETRARRLHASMVLRGSKLKSIIQGSELSVVLEDGVMVLRDPNTQAPLEIHVIRNTLTASPGKPIVYDVDGRFESTPVTIRVETSPLESFLESKDHVPLRVTSRVAGMDLRLDARLARPFSLRNIRFDLSARGQKLDDLDELLHVSVPPWGPYVIDGSIELDHLGYHAPSLAVRVGSSELTGDVSLDTTGERPRLSLNLTGRSLQLDDFDVGNWSVFEYDDSRSPPADAASRAASLREQKATVEALATSDNLRSFDARLALAVNEVLSGYDRLGSGRLVASLENGRFTLSPISVEIPEGSADGEFSFEMTEDDVMARTRVNIAHLDYGVLARRINPEADAAGWLSLDVDLRSHSRSLEHMMAGANGQFDFAVWPGNMQADIFDLWATNLLLAILPSIDSESGSRVNCIVGVFDMTYGVMAQKRLFVDTTNVQVQGEGDVDFRTGELDFLLVPNAKRPQMFVLGTPIRVSGNYWDLETSTSADHWAKTAVRFVSSIFAPIKRLFTTPIPADGEAACRAAMERTQE